MRLTSSTLYKENEMKKVMLVVLVGMVAAGLAYAGSFTDTDKAKNHGKTGLKNLTGEIDANFALVEAGSVKSATASATNGQAIALSAQVTILSGIGQTSGLTNTITFTSPWLADRVYVVTVDKDATNDIKIADSGVLVALGSDLVLEPTDAAVFLTTSTTTMVKVATSGSN